MRLNLFQQGFFDNSVAIIHLPPRFKVMNWFHGNNG